MVACQIPPLDVYSSVNNKVEFNNYRSFTVHATIKSSDQFLDLVTHNIETVLLEKGYQKDAQADFVVLFQIDIDQVDQVVQEAIPVQGKLYMRAKLEAVFKAKILVNVIDTKTNVVVWKAASSRDLSGIDTSKIDNERVHQRMLELFDSFPSK